MIASRTVVCALAALLMLTTSGFGQDAPTPQQQNAALDRKCTTLIKEAGKWQDVIDKAVRSYLTQESQIEQISLKSDIQSASFVILKNHLDSIGQNPPSLAQTLAKKKEAVKTLEDAVAKAQKFCKDHLIDPDF